MNKQTRPQPGLVPLGRVVGVHGLKGMVRVSISGNSGELDPDTFKTLGEILVGQKRFMVRKASLGQKHVLLGLKGLETREEAEGLVGQEVQGESWRFPALPTGEYYWFQVLGLPVINASNGEVLGHLAEIWPTGAHDIYVVRQENKEVLLPAVEGVIQEIKVSEGYIKVCPPDGLLDLYAD